MTGDCCARIHWNATKYLACKNYEISNKGLINDDSFEYYLYNLTRYPSSCTATNARMRIGKCIQHRAIASGGFSI